jgi:alcohol dehydrogenase (cytochrome c)
MEGLIRNESNFDLQLQTPDGRIHRLRTDQIASVSRRDAGGLPRIGSPGAATPVSGDWPTYHGKLSGNRHSSLRQIDTTNVAKLAPRWMFPVPSAQRLQVTPVVLDGIMYVTGPNEAYALDASTGRRIWEFRRPRTKGLAGDAASGINRGVAVHGARLFMVTDHAHLLALDRFTGALLWDIEMADYRQNYGATSAPLVVKDLVVSGISGGDEGVRGFLAAYKVSTGERVWRFWTIPAPGEPQSETWQGSAWEHGCASTWLTGTYDPELDLLYWTTGNPCPDYDGDERKGDNLYSDSVLALNPDTGKLKWHFQYTPHDLHDWDAQQTAMLVDATFGGRARKLLLQASRNGFFYVLDRVTGEFLRATPFVEKLTWAKGVNSKGRPELIPGNDPSAEGTRACPAVEGATNWMSTAYSPATGLFYVMALEKCTIYTKSPDVWEPGKSYYGGSTRRVPGESGQKFLRAINVQTGKIQWEVPQVGPANTWGGVLSTEGGLVFYGDDSGAFAAVDAASGKPLWHFHTNQLWKASPMTYTVDGRQFVAIAAGSNVIAFGL